MKTRAVQIATAEDLRRLNAAEQWAAELDQEAATTETKARKAKAQHRRHKKPRAKSKAGA